jgi:hypothetical protein
MDLKSLGDKAKGLIDKRGGTENLEEDAEELKGIATGKGNLADKAKAAVAAIREPGDDDATSPAPAAESAAETAEEPERSAEMVEGERSGRQAHGRHGHGGHGRGRRGGRDGDPAV